MSAALNGGYEPLVDVLERVDVGVLFLELATPRAGDMEVLRALSEDRRIGVGVVNPKTADVEQTEVVQQRISRAINLFGRERVLLTPDCGFATFADNPVASAQVAEAKLRAIVESGDLVG